MATRDRWWAIDFGPEPLTGRRDPGVIRAMGKNTASLTVGRLIEVRADQGYRTPADVDAIFEAIAREAAKVQSDAYVTVVDWRGCRLMSPEAAEHMLEKIASVNSRTERSAALARDDSPLAVLQFVRLIRNANHPDRKLFVHSGELYTWLSQVLTAAEQARLKDFLAEGSS
jgi:hypothetical protein